MVEQFVGDVEVLHPTTGVTTIKLSGERGAIYLGAQGQDGDIVVYDSTGSAVLEIDGETGALKVGNPGREGRLVVHSEEGIRAVTVLGGDASRAGHVHIGNPDNWETGPHPGSLSIYDHKGRRCAYMDPAGRVQLGSTAMQQAAEDFAGELKILDRAGQQVIHLAGDDGTLHVGGAGPENRGHYGRIKVYDDAGRTALRLHGNSAALYVGCPDGDNEGDILVYDHVGRAVLNMNGQGATLTVGADGNEGHVRVRRSDGATCIHLNGETGFVEILGGDCAEDFEIAGESAEPGTVMVIGEDGRLRASDSAYDRCVAGVVSGAGDLRPGIVLGCGEADGERRLPIALVGRVYCRADATESPIRVGDLLTTSHAPGHAMVANDPERAFGAVIGKALRPLAQGRGLIPILIAMQ